MIWLILGSILPGLALIAGYVTWTVLAWQDRKELFSDVTFWWVCIHFSVAAIASVVSLVVGVSQVFG